MQNSTTDEIASYLSHHDYSLAMRRMLDFSMDTGDEKLMYDAIGWSKLYRGYEKQETGKQIHDAFFTSAQSLLARLQAAGKNISSQNYALIEASAISKQYSQSSFSLKPVSLQLDTGNILGIVGENGNGKTTLLRCLSGQLALDSGKIEYKLLKDPDYYSIRNHVVFIPQRIPKWYGLLKDNLHFSASLAGVTGSRNQLLVDFMLERLNLSGYAHLTWGQISSGYRTRFEIARVLLQQPRLLILDEPLANLDINAQQTILTDLKFIAKSVHHPMGVILSSQQLHEVEKCAGKVIFIKQGNCIFKADEKQQEKISYALEIETTASRETILEILNDDRIEIQFNGGFYTIVSPQQSSQEIIGKLVHQQVAMSYFRDITYSTKRFF
ncbi:MAG TPA: ABC transporter ATP-binding protein [Chitinophagaceae bacterium]|nr:ABC transporter ATP-binding protein [Chitinophagaceae bacterium]